jgi:hypothetical protein
MQAMNDNPDSGYRQFTPGCCLPSTLDRRNLRQVAQHICDTVLETYGCNGAWTDGGFTTVQEMGDLISHTIAKTLAASAAPSEDVSLYMATHVRYGRIEYYVTFPSRILPQDPYDPILEPQSILAISLAPETPRVCMLINAYFVEALPRNARRLPRFSEWQAEAAAAAFHPRLGAASPLFTLGSELLPYVLPPPSVSSYNLDYDRVTAALDARRRAPR